MYTIMKNNACYILFYAIFCCKFVKPSENLKKNEKIIFSMKNVRSSFSDLFENNPNLHIQAKKTLYQGSSLIFSVK